MGSGVTPSDRSVANRSQSRPMGGAYTVAVLCLTLILSFIDRFVINLVVDPIRSDLGLSDVEISFLQGAGFAALFALAALPAGRLADWVNRPRLIAAGVIVWSLGTILCGLSTNFWPFFFARLLVGLGEASLIPAASSLIVDRFSARRRGAALGIFTLGSTSGSGIALIVGGATLSYLASSASQPLPMISSLSPWRQMMILMGFPGFALMPLLLLIRDPTRRHSLMLPALPDLLRALKAERGVALHLCFAKGLMGLGDYGMVVWLPTLLMRRYGATAVEAGGLIGLATAISGMVGAIFGGMASDWCTGRYGAAARGRVILGSYLVAVLGAVIIGLSKSGSHLALGFSIWVVGSVSGYVVGQVAMQELVPASMRATTVALSITITALIGIGLGPTLVPLIARQFSTAGNPMQVAMFIVALVAVAPAILLIARVVLYLPANDPKKSET
ncbi:MFS transporter [Sphingobium arseniciresistens]|uniref:MFS transporter n=1 Tax=Sphingobium arseniciresistens TaxID=3030834 RepID=UPI0030CA2891